MHSNEELVELIQTGTDIQRNMLALWQQNQGLIGKVACEYRIYEDLEDLKQQGYIGLYNAVEGYCPGKGVPFINYAAFWIRQSMIRYIENSGSVVRIPSCEQQKHKKYKRLLHDFEVHTGRKAAEWEVCRFMGISRDELKELERRVSMGQIGSLDSYMDENGEATIGDFVPGDTDVEGQVIAAADAELLRGILWPIVDTLPGGQGAVLRARYQDGTTLKEAGERLGVGIDKIRTMERDGLRNMRRSRNAKLLYSFLPEKVESMAYHHNGVREFDRTWTSSTELAALNL